MRCFRLEVLGNVEILGLFYVGLVFVLGRVAEKGVAGPGFRHQISIKGQLLVCAGFFPEEADPLRLHSL